MSTAIEWTEETKACRTCRRQLPLSAFGRDRSRADGLAYVCRHCKNNSARATYTPIPRPGPGRQFVPSRDGDVRQARRRVNHLVDVGVLPAPNRVPCVDCGHVWRKSERRHEYDHYLGYEAAHHADVEAVCTTCHHARENARRAAA